MCSRVRTWAGMSGTWGVVEAVGGRRSRGRLVGGRATRGTCAARGGGAGAVGSVGSIDAYEFSRWGMNPAVSS